jgi:hypothetical protein
VETEKQYKARKDFEGLFKEPFKNFGGLIFWIVVIIICMKCCA